MPPMRWLLLLILAIGTACAAQQVKSANALDEEEQATKRMEDVMRAAADYRLGRATHVAQPGEEEAIEAGIQRAEEMRLHGGRAWYQLWLISRTTRARWIAEDTFAEHPYAANAGRIIHYALDRHAELGETTGTLDALMDLWFKLPDYPDLERAFATALALAERIQDFDAKINLEASDPRDVIDINGTSAGYGVEDLFRFISEHGDRDTVAPRAALGLARSLLLTGDRSDRSKARHAYEDFLDRFPDSDLAFDVVLEQALSWLATYKGADYDIGALMAAANLVDIAELDVGGDPGRAAKVAAYRRRITSWLQDRDLSVARWYAARTRPWFLAWLKRPPSLLHPDNGARYYAKAVIGRDRAAPQSAQAQALLDRLPPEPGMLGSPR